MRKLVVVVLVSGSGAGGADALWGGGRPSRGRPCRLMSQFRVERARLGLGVE